MSAAANDAANDRPPAQSDVWRIPGKIVAPLLLPSAQVNAMLHCSDVNANCYQTHAKTPDHSGNHPLLRLRIVAYGHGAPAACRGTV
jgi:hypothetical protein